jgi:hypothetical protein
MAIVTDTFKKIIGDKLKTDFDSSGTYYFVGIGRSQIWNDSDIATTPTNKIATERDFRQNLQGVRQIADISFVVPRVNWSSGTTYSAYDDSVVGYPTPNFYLITGANDVYLCIQQGRNSTGAAVASTVEPTGTSTTLVKTADGYIWKYLYTVGAYSASRFLAGNFMPVQFIDSADSSSPASEVIQETIQNAAINRQVIGVAITSGGSGYASAPAVTISGDGTLATATAVISGGVIVNIKMDSNGSGQIKGSGYNQASISFASGTATARAILSPKAGLGANPIIDLRSSNIMMNGRPNATETGELLINQDFRQVGILRGVKKLNLADSDFTAGAGTALTKLRFNGGATAFTTDNFIIGGTSQAKAYIDFADSAAGAFIHQTETTGFRNFIVGETLSATNLAGSVTTGTAVLASFDSATVNKYSGDLLYIDNRAAITRSAGETQDIKIVIQL